MLRKLVSASNQAGIDARFIVALAGAEATYGINTIKEVVGEFNSFSSQFHCAKVGDPRATFCWGEDPYQSHLEAIQDVIDTLSSARYRSYNSTQNIYSLYERGHISNISGNQKLLDTIYRDQLKGNIQNVRVVRCKK